MPRVDFSGECINKVVLNEKRVPDVDKVNGGITPDSKITIQSKEPLEATVYGVAESDGIETVVRGCSKDILVVVRSDVVDLIFEERIHGLQNVGWCWRFRRMRSYHG